MEPISYLFSCLMCNTNIPGLKSQNAWFTQSLRISQMLFWFFRPSVVWCLFTVGIIVNIANWQLQPGTFLSAHQGHSNTHYWFPCYLLNPPTYVLTVRISGRIKKWCGHWRGDEFVGLDFLTTIVMKAYVFWNITACSPLKVNPCFGGKCHLCLRDRRTSQARNQDETNSKPMSGSGSGSGSGSASACYSLVSWLACFSGPENGDVTKLRSIFNKLHRVTSQKLAHRVTTSTE